MHVSKMDQPLGNLFTDFRREISSLLQKEVDLGRAEINEKVSQVGSGLASLAAGAAVLLVGLLVLLNVVVFFVALFLPPSMAPWLAPLIVGGIVTIIGIIMVAKGRSNLKPDNLKTSRTAESIRQDSQLVREQMQ